MSMSETPNSPWIHIGECPVCVDGLCRVRTCALDGADEHFYAICDECDATWIEPDTATPKMFPDAMDPLCPICSSEMYGRQAHWSLGDELVGTAWEANAIFDVPSSVLQSLAERKLMTSEEAVDSADATSTVTPNTGDSTGTNEKHKPT